MKKILLLVFILSITLKMQAQGTLCNLATPFCAGSNAFSYPAGVNAGTGQHGPNYGCLGSTPDPAWYYMQVDLSGNIEFEIHTTPKRDVDYICWGPFTSYTLPCVAQLTGDSYSHGSHHSPGPGGNYPTFNTVDCSYDPSWEEWCYIPNAVAGNYYILLITNYSNQSCNISFSQISGNGSTNCAVFPLNIANNGPICEGDSLHLTANLIPNAQYYWVGPNSFTSNSQNPTIYNVTNLNAGSYSCHYSTIYGVSITTSTNAIIHPKPLTSNIYHIN